MRIYDEQTVKCIKSEQGFEEGKEYQIAYIKYGSNGNDYEAIYMDDGSKDGLKLTTEEFSTLFEVPYSFEEDVIDPILNTIKDNQEYLTQPENLPQLAKLGFMYNTLWYAGRVCWGYDGIISKGGYDCEDNPKYKIEMCEPKNNKIEDLIYDAWGMHVSNDIPKLDFDKFSTIIYKGRETTEFEMKMLKKNKTFDEWVEILTDKRYRYHSIYPDRKSVANHLLCVIGNGYGINKDGFVISEASGADQDIDDYGDWQNAKFSPEIEKIVDSIMAKPQVKETLDKTCVWATEMEEKRDKEQKASIKSFVDFDYFTQEEFDSLTYRELMDRIMEKHDKDPILNKGRREKKYSKYYPISNYSILHIIVDKSSRERIGLENVHQSYIDAGIEICKEILTHQDEEEKNNVEFAKRFLAVNDVEGYEEFKPEDFDIDSVMDEINKNFDSILKENTTKYSINLSDRRKNEYGDDNASIYVESVSDTYPKGLSNDVEVLENTPLYELKEAISKTLKIKGVNRINFYYENVERFSINIKITINKGEDTLRYIDEKVASDEEFKSNGFIVGGSSFAKKFDYKGKTLIMLSRKPEPLGSTHPNNKSGKEYFSQNKFFQVLDSEWNKIADFNIDERGFNTFTANNTSDDELRNLFVNEFKKLKASDPAYGTYDSISNRDNTKEGKKNLYVFDLMNWMENNYSRKAKLKNLI